MTMACRDALSDRANVPPSVDTTWGVGEPTRQLVGLANQYDVL